MRLLLLGHLRDEVSHFTKASSGTVSNCYNDFKRDATRMGLDSVGRQYNVSNVIDEMRTLGAEIRKNNLTIVQAKMGIHIQNLLESLGVDEAKLEARAKVVLVCIRSSREIYDTAIPSIGASETLNASFPIIFPKAIVTPPNTE